VSLDSVGFGDGVEGVELAVVVVVVVDGIDLGSGGEGGSLRGLVSTRARHLPT
jgi:hypothetical protein